MLATTHLSNSRSAINIADFRNVSGARHSRYASKSRDGNNSGDVNNSRNARNSTPDNSRGAADSGDSETELAQTTVGMTAITVMLATAGTPTTVGHQQH